MNKTFLTVTILFSFLLLNVHYTAAAAPTPSPEPKSSSSSKSSPAASSSAEKSIGEKLNQQINQLKERIASRVAELNLVEKRGVIGTVSDTSGNQITFKDITNKTRYIDVDEITKFESSDSKNGFGLSDLVKGTKISVLGNYNKQSQRILGRFIETITTPTYLSARIADIDKKNYIVTVISEDKKQTKVDVGTSTTISTYSKEDGITKYGFSKLEIGDKVMVTGFPDKKESGLLVATRILDLSELPANPNIIIPQSSEEISPTPEVTEDNTPSPKVLKKITPTKTKSE